MRINNHASLRLNGKRVCKKMFIFAYAFSSKRYDRLRNQMNSIGVDLKYNGHMKNTYNQLEPETTKQIILFIENFANINGYPQPGRGASVKSADILLSTDITKAKIFETYIKQCDEEHKISSSTFNKIWATNLGHIKIQTARTDVCKTCRLITREIIEKRHKISIDAHQELVLKLNSHLKLVKDERAYYKQTIIDASRYLNETFSLNTPNSKDIEMHYSFDYAQQIHIPHDPLQPGPMFFLVPYKVQVFGIANEALKMQHNYLNPESSTIGKGSDSVISFLHHYFEKYGVGEKTVILHADNCGGQNKNRYVMNYLAFRILNKLHSDITIVFMPVGHTKFYCDLAFGLFKKKFKRTQVSDLEQLENCVLNSTPSSKLNKCQLIGNENGSNINVDQYKWSEWFDQEGFSNIPGIRKLHYFKFQSLNPNFVLVKKKSTDEYVSVRLIETYKPLKPFPEKSAIPKIGFERQKYLFEHIRQYCAEDSKDVLCPDPTIGIFVETSQATFNTTTRSTERVRAISKCSICQIPGHNKAKCPNKPV